MLDRLRSLHDNVLRGIDTLEAALAKAEPCIATVSGARLALTRASRARASFLEESVYPAVIALGGPAIASLRDQGRERTAVSAEHIRHWTVAEIERHWPEYRRASMVIRANMRTRIREEQALLYPLLRTLDSV